MLNLCSAIESSTRNSLNSRESVSRSMTVLVDSTPASTECIGRSGTNTARCGPAERGGRRRKLNRSARRGAILHTTDICTRTEIENPVRGSTGAGLVRPCGRLTRSGAAERGRVGAPVAAVPRPQHLGRRVGREPRRSKVQIGLCVDRGRGRRHRFGRCRAPRTAVEPLDQLDETGQLLERRLVRMARPTAPTSFAAAPRVPARATVRS